MDVGAVVGIVGAAVGVLGLVIGYTRAVAQAPLEAKTHELEAQVQRQKERIDELKAENLETSRNLAELRDGKAGVLVKTDLDDELRLVMQLLGASAASILIPSPNRDSLVFLSAHGPAAAQLRKTKLPLDKGKAAMVFASGTPSITAKPYRDPEFLDAVDVGSRQRTTSLLTLPLECDERVVGVVQFLNKNDGAAFDDDDQRTGLRFTSTLAEKVAQFVGEADNFRLLGLAPDTPSKEASILFCDLTCSATLFDAMDTGSAVDCLNQYLERQCDVAFRFGGTVDSYMGDGAMLRFNVPRPVEGDHVVLAVEAAAAMLADFAALKQSWLGLGLHVEPLHARVGIASGSVVQALVGHPQHQHLTVFGTTVNRAASLCDDAPRDHDVIVADAAVVRRLAGRYDVHACETPGMSEIVVDQRVPTG